MPKVSGGGATNHFPHADNFQGRRVLNHLPGLIRVEMVEKRSLYSKRRPNLLREGAPVRESVEGEEDAEYRRTG